MARAARALVLAAVVASSAAGQGATGPDVATLERVVRAQADSGFVGLVLVTRGDSVVFRRSYGPPGARPTDSSLFWIASVTKSFTAAAVLTLERAGRLAVSDSISRFFPDAPADKRAITVRQLLTHTAGFGATYAGSGIVTRDSAVRSILAQPLVYAPGRGYRYGDNDYELLAAIIEVVTGDRWSDYVERAVLAPRALRHTGFWCRAAAALGRPIAGVDGSRSWCGDAAGSRDDWGHRGANGMFATADDVLRWTLTLGAAMTDGSAQDSQHTSSVPEILVRREGDYEVFYGSGARIYRLNGRVAEVMLSGSGDDGHTVIARHLSSGLTLVVLATAGQHAGTTWASYLAARLAPRD